MEDIKTPFGPIGEFVFKRTYSRRLEDNEERTESFHQTIVRVLDASRDQLKVPDLNIPAYYNKAYRLLKELKGSVAGRFLWQLGTSTVDRLGLLSLQNCAFTVINTPVRPFTWAFDALMLGSGVGFNIQLKHVYSLPPVLKGVSIRNKDTKDADFIVPDSREGWIALLDKVLTAFFISGESFTYSTILVRGAGELIKGFGGTASGPGPLVRGITNIIKLLTQRAGKKLSPVDALDIMNIIGSVVVAGNVRRSAQIALGDTIDRNYLSAKRWDLGNIPSYRAMSNNSIIAKDIDELPDYFWDGYAGNGEPYGLINLPLSRAVGRLGETQYPDPEVEGYNPCLHPDSLVETVKGRVKIKDITEPTYVYTMKEGGKLGVAKSSAAWLSKKNAKTLKITINSGSSIIVTPDHKIYTKNRGWLEAQELKINDEVVHLSRARRGAAYAAVRLTMQDPSEQVMEHRLVYAGVHGDLKSDMDVHHVDGNTHNNHIDNLVMLSKSDHAKISIRSHPNNHQVHGPDGDFISGPDSKKGAKTIKNLPYDLQTGLIAQPFVVKIEEGPITDVYDLTVEETHNFIAENIVVHNCAEQSLSNFETCCLAEVFLPNNKTKEELWDVVELLYKINKHSLMLPCHLKETEEVVHRNMRMGIGITGYLQASDEQKSWLSDTYKRLREFDETYSQKHGMSRSIKLTTVKPSGTLSLLAGVTPGVHPGYSQYHLRRVRLRTDDPLTQKARDAGYPVEFVRGFDGTEDKETSIISFPCAFPEGTVLAKDVSAIDQLEYVKELQTSWSDNSVSCTVYYRKDELPSIKEWLSKNYKDSVKSVSFLLHSDHGFDQAPLEEISKERYEELTQYLVPIEFDEVQHELDSSLECGSGGCPII